MFGSKKQQKNNQAPAASSQVNQDIYVMPEKFHPQGKGSSGKTLIIVLIILIIVVIISSTYFLYDLWQQNQQKNLANNNANNNAPVINYNADIETNVNTNTENVNNTNEANINDEVNANSETNTEVNSNANVNNNSNINTEVSLNPPPVSSDADSDGLTDMEENAIGTNSSQPDTDKDSYLDGTEVERGYNPLKAGSTNADKLPAASFIRVIATNFPADNFQVFSIKNWQSNIIDASRQLLLTTQTGEIIRISVRDNTDRLSAINWYAQANPQISLSQLTQIKVGTLDGLIAPDNLKAYLTNADHTKIYVFEYIMSDDTEFRYPTLFKMIVSSFKSLAAGVPSANTTASSTPANTNSGSSNTASSTSE